LFMAILLYVFRYCVLMHCQSAKNVLANKFTNPRIVGLKK
jgi:hypothetical protein